MEPGTPILAKNSVGAAIATSSCTYISAVSYYFDNSLDEHQAIKVGFCPCLPPQGNDWSI